MQEALQSLANSGDPAKLGIRKCGEYSDAYAYDVGRSIRLIYRVNFKNLTIELLAIGSHKEVYGKD